MNAQMAKQNAAVYWLLAAVLYKLGTDLWVAAAIVGLLEIVALLPWLAGAAGTVLRMAMNRRARRHRPSYKIGGVWWWPVVITRAVQEQLWAIAPASSWAQGVPEQMKAMLAATGQLQDYEEKKPELVRAEAVEAVDSLYSQLMLLLRDKEGRPPEPDFIEQHLAVQRAARLVNEIVNLPMHAYEDA